MRERLQETAGVRLQAQEVWPAETEQKCGVDKKGGRKLNFLILQTNHTQDIKSCASKVDLDGMFSHFVKWGELVDQMVYPPHQDFINIRKGIRNCLYQHSPNKCRAREDQEDSDDEEAQVKKKIN